MTVVTWDFDIVSFVLHQSAVFVCEKTNESAQWSDKLSARLLSFTLSVYKFNIQVSCLVMSLQVQMASHGPRKLDMDMMMMMMMMMMTALHAV